MAEEEDPFGMGAPPLADPMGGAPPLTDFGEMGGFDAPAPPLDAAAPPSEGLDGFGDMSAPPPEMPSSDGLPTFGDMSAPPPEMPPMGGDMGMGGMDMGGGMPDMGGGMDMGGMDMGSAPPPMDGGMGMGMAPPMGNDFVAASELGPVAKWRIENSEKVAAKAAAAAAAEAAKVAEAQAALQQFYAERSEKTSKRAQTNREAAAAYTQERDAAMIADSWDSVCKLVDLKEKAGQEVDTSRMRSLLIQLKN